MALNNHDQAQIREYLLGKLSEVEQEKIEERLMVEDELFDEFEVSKDELVEEYCAGELDRAERQWFESHFLASAEGRQRRAFALAMNCLREPQPALVSQTKPWPELHVERRVTFFERLAAFVKMRPWTVATVTAVVLVIALVLVATRSGSRRQGEVFAATLTNATLKRGAEGPLPTKLHLPSNTAQLKLRLELPKAAAPGTRYKAELDDRVNRKPVEIVQSDPQSATVVIPTELVPRGEYSVLLTTKNPNGITQQLSYLFNIE
jgi:hypothetical protein